MDEVSRKLSAVSEALALLEDAAILPSLYRLLESVQVEVDRRSEARAKTIAADRIERVSVRVVCLFVLRFYHHPCFSPSTSFRTSRGNRCLPFSLPVSACLCFLTRIGFSIQIARRFSLNTSR